MGRYDYNDNDEDDKPRETDATTKTDESGNVVGSTTHVGAQDRSASKDALAQADREKAAHDAIVAKDQTDPDMPKPPNTAGMNLVQAAAANQDYNRRLAAYRSRPATKASPSPSPQAQAQALRSGQ